MKNNVVSLAFDKYTKIIDKALTLGIKSVGLFNWTEPFLCKNIHQYACYAKSKGMYCSISTNLSLPNIPELIPSLKYCDRLMVSVSGFNQDVYKVNHRGGNIWYVKKNLKIISEAKKDKEIATKVVIKYITFDYNVHEFELFEDFGNHLGLITVKRHGAENPRKTRNKILKNNNGKLWLREFIESGISNFDYTNESMNEICTKTVDSFVIDAYGSCFLCCLTPNFKYTKVGDFLSEDIDIIQFRRYTHPLCAFCRLRKPIFPAPEETLSFLRGCMKRI